MCDLTVTLSQSSRGVSVGGKQMDQGSSLCGITFLFNTLCVDTVYWVVKLICTSECPL